MDSSENSNVAIADKSDDSSRTYVLRDLISDVPLDDSSHITSVDAWNGNLYIGTSAGAVLHYVSIPPDPSDENQQPSYIFATKLEPPYTTKQEGVDAGVKQILVLPDAGKACVLCNATLTFYTLPELSPAFGGQIKQSGCLWVGGLDANLVSDGGEEDTNGTVIVICLKQRVRLVKITKEAANPRKIRDIELGGVSAIQRRGDLACVADGTTYSLLDVVNQRKNDLFPISSLTASEPEMPRPEMPVPSTRGPSRSFSTASPARQGPSHERNVSLGAEPKDGSRLRPGSSSQWPTRASSRQRGLSPAHPLSRETSPVKADDASPRNSAEIQSKPDLAASARPLRANIVTPTANEFLLTTGTQPEEPGVGMFVNTDGDVTRGTMEFSSYPESLVLDGGSGQNADSSMPGPTGEGGYVLALVRRKAGEGWHRGIEVQRWDVEAGEAQHDKCFLDLGILDAADPDTKVSYGLRSATSVGELVEPGISSSLRLRRLNLGSGDVSSDEDAVRNSEEDKYAAHFAQIRAGVLFFSQDKVRWVSRNPLIMRLERQLDSAAKRAAGMKMSVDVPAAQTVINSIRGQEARSELEFLTLTYIRQKASLLLFGNLVLQTAQSFIAYERDKRFAEDALVDGEIDPRIVLSLVPPLNAEIEEGSQGIWVAEGIGNALALLRRSFSADNLVQDPKGAYGDNLLNILKRYLMTWRKKKGFGSVADETHVFNSVDAALLHVLLLLDQNSPRGPATTGSLRAELNDVVDKGVDCFERAVQLFQQFGRLYMLSRLYQSRKMAAQVLGTWKRILEGEKDAGGELIEGEHDLRRYLAKIRDHALVEEYGAWLAQRNPKLGVQIFADENGRVKFAPEEAVKILKENAPGAVKEYLEHLVFAKHHVQYVNDLIAFYLDSVLHELSTSEAARETLLQSYATYRALKPPKPTYRQFIIDNAVEAEWWENRLRLLQLIGGSHGAASKYDVHTLRERLVEYSEELVPEMIILNGREGKHQEALRLLVQGLGDYDTAVRYCLLSGSSIFHPSSGLAPEQRLPSKDEQAELFSHLLNEFFAIEDLGERLERTAELLERFGAWFDIGRVLDLIPEDWSVELVSGFLVHALRRLVRERNETIVVKALAGAQNLKKSSEVIEKIESVGPVVQRSETEIGEIH